MKPDISEHLLVCWRGVILEHYSELTTRSLYVWSCKFKKKNRLLESSFVQNARCVTSMRFCVCAFFKDCWETSQTWTTVITKPNIAKEKLPKQPHYLNIEYYIVNSFRRCMLSKLPAHLATICPINWLCYTLSIN